MCNTVNVYSFVKEHLDLKTLLYCIETASAEYRFQHFCCLTRRSERDVINSAEKF